jgi:TatD DNase family protein
MKLLPIDFHTHLDPDIDPGALLSLDAVVFGATPSLSAASVGVQRQDRLAVWGVGCHPALVGAQEAWQVPLFKELVIATAFVSEVGLDGDSRVPLELQAARLDEMLSIVRSVGQRLVSLHSYRATSELLSVLERYPSDGYVLHWWLGSRDETRRALELGCYFSVNASSARRSDLLDEIPISRLLTETDHPAGNRFAGPDQRPGNVTSVEKVLAGHYGLSMAQVREQMWRNLGRLVVSTNCGHLLPRNLRVRLSAL